MSGSSNTSEAAPAPTIQQYRLYFLVCCVVVVSAGFFYYQQFASAGQKACKTAPSLAELPPDGPTPQNVTSYKIISLPSDKVNIRAVYLDRRPRNGFNYASVFLVEIHRELAKKGGGIVACGTSEAVSKALEIRVAGNMKWVHQTHTEINHDVAMIDCFGLPANTSSGARVFLWYRIKDGGDLYRVESEQTYFIPLEKDARDQNKLKTVVCMAVLYSNPPYMRQFLRYYKHLGVDHIYILAEDSFIRSGVLETDKFTEEALRDGFISYSVWHNWLSSREVYYHSQMLAYENCIYRFQGTYDYAFFVDSDDHFIPLVPDQKKLDYYIKSYCTNGACSFLWKEYFTDCGQDWSRLGPHGNVTNTLLSHTHVIRGKGEEKSLYRISAALDAGIHSPRQLMKGHGSKTVPLKVAYVAHVRSNRHPPKKLHC
ncbi:hypothetical protein GBAR_LOCUS14403 [Geodia barretti]|uniref:Glycosyltransferase family 92 protein n=1 Tax=Geodia barretti TaxID=519541 RepID=A0AA35WSI8_GEOBA|nr:hypothetical protein GBAR_LOCUS14403 [Geodia barretti]